MSHDQAGDQAGDHAVTKFDVTSQLTAIAVPTVGDAVTQEERDMVAQAKALADNLLVPTTDAEALEASAIREDVFGFHKLLEERRTAFKAPVLRAGKQIDEAFKPHLKTLELALDRIKGRLTAWTIVVEGKRREAERAALAAAPANQAANVAPITAAVIQADNSAKLVKTREFKEVVIVDDTLIPRGYLVPDLPKIRAAALAGQAIPGVEVQITRRATN